jgi:hypothetical protein
MREGFLKQVSGDGYQSNQFLELYFRRKKNIPGRESNGAILTSGMKLGKQQPYDFRKHDGMMSILIQDMDFE